MAVSIFKFHILRPHTTSNAIFTSRRFRQLSLLLRPLHSLPHPPPILRHPIPPPPPPLLRRRFHPPPPPMSAVNSSPAADKTVKVVVKGRVQGVFYRNWTVENARELGLKGWVRNRRDGAVEAVFSGSADKVEEMEQRCRRGPPDAMVTGFHVSPCSDDPGATFERRPTV
ncbi:acylphosphatase [Salvia splendens]|uniref:acylphosphatase n=1 Tax=Salvia splendens TaxID=180675 RepID=UPI001C26CC49|nr:acylphosphatase [Salvia splendens]